MEKEGPPEEHTKVKDRVIINKVTIKISNLHTMFEAETETKVAKQKSTHVREIEKDRDRQRERERGRKK